MSENPSTADDRTRNNTLRHKYRTLTEDEKIEMDTIKDLGQQLLNEIEDLGQSRELSTAKTRLEEAVMWACKHITN